MPAVKGLINNITAEEFEIQLLGGNKVRFPYNSKYAHMRKYEIVWVFMKGGSVTELHTLACLVQRAAVATLPTNCTVLQEVEDMEPDVPILVER
jgi:hypothetical protein